MLGNDTYRLIQGDCLDELKQLEADSVDSVVTDPPYGIGFMGKSWDTFKPGYAASLVSERPKHASPKGGITGFNKSAKAGLYDRSLKGIRQYQNWCYEWAKECLRVLKPGGYLLASNSPRMYHRMTCGIEDAGFEIRDMISWNYGSGFPKSLNVGVQIGKMYLCQYLETVKLAEIKLKLTPVESSGEMIGFVAVSVGTNQEGEQENKMVIGVAEGSNEAMDILLYESTEPIGSNTILSLKKKLEEVWKRENNVITLTKLKMIIDLKIYSLFQYQNTLNSTIGTGTALKPAHEPIVVARKPLSEKTVAVNVLKWGTGGINIDGSRVGTEDMTSGGSLPDIRANNYENSAGKKRLDTPTETKQGRFPANFIHDGSDEVVRLFPESKSTGGVNGGKLGQSVYGKFKNEMIGANAGGLGDSGSAARFFYCAKASKSERNAGLVGFEEKTSRRYGEMGQGPTDQQTPSLHKPEHNHHPTVKPVSLMKYLIKLVTPPKGTVLDPFMGSGTTGVACKELGFEFIGIEREEEYIKIAEARIKNVPKTLI
ncbi:MAG: site-specific DNA-methyltransferase [Nitrosopumilus sp.]